MQPATLVIHNYAPELLETCREYFITWLQTKDLDDDCMPSQTVIHVSHILRVDIAGDCTFHGDFFSQTNWVNS